MSLSLSLGFINPKNLLKQRAKEETLYSTQQVYNTVIEGDTEELIGGLRAPETVDIPLDVPEQVVEVVKPLWKIWHTDPANHIMLAIVIILLAGKIGEEVAKKLGAPGVN